MRSVLVFFLEVAALHKKPALKTRKSEGAIPVGGPPDGVAGLNQGPPRLMVTRMLWQRRGQMPLGRSL